jgi:uncharacterized membrane-anchored protein YitT (DUF2179 family)
LCEKYAQYHLECYSNYNRQTGSVICAVAVNSILIPKQFLTRGFTGLSLLIHYALPLIPVGAIYFALNIPVFIFGWLFVGHRFFSTASQAC